MNIYSDYSAQLRLIDSDSDMQGAYLWKAVKLQEAMSEHGTPSYDEDTVKFYASECTILRKALVKELVSTLDGVTIGQRLDTLIGGITPKDFDIDLLTVDFNRRKAALITAYWDAMIK